MLHVIAMTLSLLLLAGMFGRNLDIEEGESTGFDERDEISDGDGTA